MSRFINRPFKKGMIIEWDGPIASIPAGWALHEVLKNRVTIGAGDTYNVGDTGGSVLHMHGKGTLVTSVSPDTEEVQSGSDFTVANSVHTHAISGNVASSSSLPPYYALCKIIKL